MMMGPIIKGFPYTHSLQSSRSKSCFLVNTMEAYFARCSMQQGFNVHIIIELIVYEELNSLGTKQLEHLEKDSMKLKFCALGFRGQRILQ